MLVSKNLSLHCLCEKNIQKEFGMHLVTICFSCVCYDKHNGWIHTLHWGLNQGGLSHKTHKAKQDPFLSLQEFAHIMQCTTGHSEVSGCVLQKVNNITQKIYLLPSSTWHSGFLLPSRDKMFLVFIFTTTWLNTMAARLVKNGRWQTFAVPA